MKKAFIYIVMVMIQLGTVSLASAEESNGWHGSVSVELGSDGSATVQEACGFIAIQNWNDEGKPMIGKSTSALPTMVKSYTDVSVTAVRKENGDLEITIGDEPTETLKPGFGPAVICG